MNNRNVTALGYFGNSQGSAARLKNVVRAYSLDGLTEVDALLTAADMAPEVRSMLRAVLTSERVTGWVGAGCPLDGQLGILRGFMVLFDHTKVTLSLYIKEKGRRTRNLTAVIPGLTRMRQKRLH